MLAVQVMNVPAADEEEVPGETCTRITLDKILFKSSCGLVPRVLQFEGFRRRNFVRRMFCRVALIGSDRSLMLWRCGVVVLDSKRDFSELQHPHQLID